MNIRAALILLLVWLPSCAAQSQVAPREIFDEQSGSTLTVVSKPLVFARERSDVAAHARDYATVVAVEIDRSGAYQQYLLLYRWSTVDRRMSPPPDPAAGAMRLLADGRPIELLSLDRMPVSLQRSSELHVPDHAAVVTRAYKVDPALLHFIATSGTLTLRMPRESLDVPFTLWEDGRGALVKFLQTAAAP